MLSIKKQLSKCKHPNSRKTIALAKQLNKTTNRDKQKMGQYMKQNLIGEKISWFRDNLDPEVAVCTPEIVDELIKKYMARFEDELQQISLKQSIGDRKNRQHASREDIIKLTIKRELEEYNTCGLEIPDLLNNHNLSVIRKWNGELRFLQNIKMKRMGKKSLSQSNTEDKKLNKTKNKTKPKTEVVENDNVSTEMDVDG